MASYKRKSRRSRRAGTVPKTAVNNTTDKISKAADTAKNEAASALAKGFAGVKKLFSGMNIKGGKRTLKNVKGGMCSACDASKVGSTGGKRKSRKGGRKTKRSRK